MEDGLITQQQASVILGITRQRVNQMVREGLLTTLTVLGHPALSLAQVLALKEKRAKGRKGEKTNASKE